MTKTHDYAFTLKNFDLSTVAGCGDTSYKLVDFKDWETIRHALTVMEKLPGVLEGLRLYRLHSSPDDYIAGYNAALDAVAEAIKQMEVKS